MAARLEVAGSGVGDGATADGDGLADGSIEGEADGGDTLGDDADEAPGDGPGPAGEAEPSRPVRAMTMTTRRAARTTARPTQVAAPPGARAPRDASAAGRRLAIGSAANAAVAPTGIANAVVSSSIGVGSPTRGRPTATSAD